MLVVERDTVITEDEDAFAAPRAVEQVFEAAQAFHRAQQHPLEPSPGNARHHRSPEALGATSVGGKGLVLFEFAHQFAYGLELEVFGFGLDAEIAPDRCQNLDVGQR